VDFEHGLNGLMWY